MYGEGNLPLGLTDSLIYISNDHDGLNRQE
jgi:hypothetical protein